MRQLNYIGPRKLEWIEAPEPQIEEPHQALVRPLAVATCDLDAAIVAGKVPVQGPFPFGHEAVGEVIGVGDDVKAFAVGDMVSIPFQLSCGDCAQCQRGRTAHCTGLPGVPMYGLGSLGGTEWGGFLSDVVRVPYADHMLLNVPAGVDPLAVASLSDNIADGWRWVAPYLAEEPGSPVLILGAANSVPLYAAAIALALGASRVDYMSNDQHARDVASLIGANPIEGPFPRKAGEYPITVSGTADQTALQCAIRSTAPDGVCLSSGMYFGGDVPMPLLGMYVNGIRFITGRVHARAVMPAAAQLVAEGKVHPELVTAQVVSWEEAPDALAVHRTKTVVSRVSN